MASPASPPPPGDAPMELDTIHISSDDGSSSSLMSPLASRIAPERTSEPRSIVPARPYRNLALLHRSITAHSGVESRLERIAAIENDLYVSGAAPVVVERIHEMERAHRAVRSLGTPLDLQVFSSEEVAPPGGWVTIEDLERIARESTKPPLELIYELMSAVTRVRPSDLPEGALLSLGDRRKDAVEEALRRVGNALTDRALEDIRGGVAEFLIDASRVVTVVTENIPAWKAFFQRLACCCKGGKCCC